MFRLLDKRRERREDGREYKMEIPSLRRDDTTRESRSERRKVHVDDLRERRVLRLAIDETTNREPPLQRDRRDTRIEEQRSNRHIRMEQQESYSEVEIIEPLQRSSLGREKRHKRSHKHERTRDREREKMEIEMG